MSPDLSFSAAVSREILSIVTNLVPVPSLKVGLDA